jgi:MFS family permease
MAVSNGWVQVSSSPSTQAWQPTQTNVSTTFQLVWGRLSDIFGRKIILMTCLVIFMLGDFLCGFSQSAIQLYIFRAIAGIGGGGINSLCKIIISDIVSLKDRGKVFDSLSVLIQYAGIMGVAVALGSGAVVEG